jgi:hypothetical protein
MIASTRPALLNRSNAPLLDSVAVKEFPVGALPATKFRLLVKGRTPPVGYAVKNPPAVGPTAVRFPAIAVAVTGIEQPPLTPDTWNLTDWP